MESLHPVEMPYHAGPFLDLAESVSRWSIGYVREPDAANTQLLDLARLLLGNLQEINAAIAMAFSKTEEAMTVPEDDEIVVLDPEDSASVMERLNNILFMVSSTRRSIFQLKPSFVGVLRDIDNALASDLQRELETAVASVEEFEQLLILLGAGTDEDVSRIMHLVPTPEVLGYVA